MGSFDISAGSRNNLEAAMGMTSHTVKNVKGKKETHMAKKKNGKADKVPKTTDVVKTMAKTPDSKGRLVASADKLAAKLDVALSAGGPGSGRKATMGDVSRAMRKADLHEARADDHEWKGEQAEDAGDKDKTAYHNKMMSLHSKASDHYSKAVDSFDQSHHDRGFAHLAKADDFAKQAKAFKK